MVGFGRCLLLQGDEQGQQAEAAVRQKAQHRLNGQDGQVQQSRHGSQQAGRHTVRNHSQLGLRHTQRKNIQGTCILVSFL